jgi:hypothetical protein
LNNITTNDGSLGKQMMDQFPQIIESHRVAWWNTYKKAAADGISDQRSSLLSNIKKELKGSMCNPVKC